ncbi:MAG: plasmid mobilization relaxosome protein MobC [Bacteroidales bacterium]|nr:plasmid mobilization relaxosome protein MobC [Bacteroidales bacterium]
MTVANEKNDAKRRRRGPAPLSDTDKRGHTVSVRLNAAELAWLDQARAAVSMQRGEYLRAAALGKLPPTIPELNQTAWIALSRAAANLNQIAHRLNAGETLPLAEVQTELAAFRRDLIGVTK